MTGAPVTNNAEYRALARLLSLVIILFLIFALVFYIILPLGSREVGDPSPGPTPTPGVERAP